MLSTEYNVQKINYFKKYLHASRTLLGSTADESGWRCEQSSNKVHSIGGVLTNWH